MENVSWWFGLGGFITAHRSTQRWGEEQRAIELWKWKWEVFVEDVVRECESVGARVVNVGKVPLTDYYRH